MRRRILVVDQNADNAAVIRMALEDAHDIVVVNDREAAEQALATHPAPDLLVLDYGLPDGWGLSLCRAVKRTRATLPIIVLTAVTHLVADAHTCADVVLEKPFQPDVLRIEGDRLLEGAP